MKRIGVVIVLTALIGLILAGCTEKSEPEPVTEPVSGIVSSIPWGDRELIDYTIQDYDGNEIGSTGLTLARELGDAYVLKQVLGYKGQVFVFLIIVKVRADNLKPVTGMITLGNISPAPLTEFRYEDSTLSIENTNTEGEVTYKTIDIPEDAYDHYELPFLLRAIPLELGYTTTFTNVIVNRAEKQAATVTVIGEEELQVPAGNFDTYKVELTSAGDTKYFWCAKDMPHYMVKWDNGAEITLLEEVKEEL